jgi:hypothetical protein
LYWRFLEQKLGAVYAEEPGRPPLPTRLMAGLLILKHSYDLSDEAVRALDENPYFQCFRGEEFFQYRLVFDRSSRQVTSSGRTNLEFALIRIARAGLRCNAP